MDCKDTVSVSVSDCSEQSKDDKNRTSCPTVQVRFNGSVVKIVDKKKLLEKSPYFKPFENPCFQEHNSEFLEVKLEVSIHVFEIVMDYISTGKIDISNEILIDLHRLSNYLGMEYLEEHCLNFFTYSVNVTNIDNQIENFNAYPFVFQKYIKRAATLKDRKLRSFSGFYFFDCRDSGNLLNLKMFCEATGSSQIVSQLNKEIDIAFAENRSAENVENISVERLQNFLIINLLKNKSNYFFKYNLISGKVSQVSMIPVSNAQTVFCTNDKKLFLVRHKRKESFKSSYLLSVYELDNADSVTLSKENNFHIPIEELPQKTGEIILEFVNLMYDKLFLFYTAKYSSHSYDYYEKTKCLYCVIICAKNLCFEKLIEIDLSVFESKFYDFFYVKKMFSIKSRVYINLKFLEHKFGYGKEKSWTKEVTFDCKTLNSDFAKDLKPVLLKIKSENEGYSAKDFCFSVIDDFLYSVCFIHKHDVETEKKRKSKGYYKTYLVIKVFEYQNGKFKDAEINWKSSGKTQMRVGFSRIFSCIFAGQNKLSEDVALKNSE